MGLFSSAVRVLMSALDACIPSVTNVLTTFESTTTHPVQLAATERAYSPSSARESEAKTVLGGFEGRVRGVSSAQGPLLDYPMGRDALLC